MKKEYRRSLNFTMEQVFYLDKIADFSDATFAKVARDMIEDGINDAVAVIEITANRVKYTYDFVKNNDYAPIVSSEKSLPMVPKPSKREWEKILQGNHLFQFNKYETFNTNNIDDYKIITVKEYFNE